MTDSLRIFIGTKDHESVGRDDSQYLKDGFKILHETLAVKGFLTAYSLKVALGVEVDNPFHFYCGDEERYLDWIVNEIAVLSKAMIRCPKHSDNWDTCKKNHDQAINALIEFRKDNDD